MDKFLFRLRTIYVFSLKHLTLGLVVVSGLGVLTMTAVTCLDIILRMKPLNRPITGAYDIVQIAGCISLAAALPYTTAVKGHVAIEFFFQKFNRRGRIIVDSFMRLMAMALFYLMGHHCIIYGNSMLKAKQVTQTLQLPIFWLPWLIGGCCFVVILVIAYNLVNPGREMIKP
ncbi:TRAP-type C4-dicarboxylate transport system, small permease component [Limihaloglobus sulfuriphilus]|uniref:TRAP-type C4-dicarboxylate transport system, small permease component n=1 Tax=Limihaloglobus sulfuriphilus TaxID=1851148 RepID=A0A1Q2MDP0_9BACT|nr:TRAP transporter small permease subunit [Limihaloglobus sulfuriphilus]AQQ70811.1 TRAP-type C4-dicarboxylate transport system, small permease component [Limihaloglobus sulfuriphilus]